ncbi:RsmF rRNA methyltransferase first C-terminal domain-containing protein [Limosilactobacillus sp. STM2_1]|uniref:RsmF rRNA methyltransferase first C-terminal domain-containing protein n=1 Tax=Limosilactobacillus rudii TaxID=2759755 RepID=A0A7W3UK38_9LACO|nr:RsmF rRNA methyltransferase first C-terminal domain-containing protein [Limosilactobacillus rudii]MBB1079156.1 RsmF rRNA methyltransferase first C-terminal domain-containing protein [Limosilactobacillus rudii]MBB1096969.1 RsmF rRNA methyltransferase first C-terminal domain-containing protein [Limosilactobacillus rudii]MCD7133937.1 RsmF rRNA methyltransferase first C-terminal domain-containing protein [Limosilactobacillus rudii]
MQLPNEFVTKYKKLMGAEAEEFLSALAQPSYSGFRVNPLKNSQPDATIADAKGKVPYVPTGYYGQVKGKALDHVAGWVYSQEPSAMFVGEVVNPQAGERVLDLCAAPGGKTTHLAAKMANKGLLVANEIFPKRAKILAENLERWGAKNAVVVSESPADLEKQFTHYFDRILVDAPCSGEGMFRKEPAGIEYWSTDYPRECANRQQKILDSAMKMLKPGGTLVYSTCTFAPEEDEQNISWLITKYPALKLVPIEKAPGMDDGRPEWADGNEELKKTVRLFPHHIKGEGHFIAKVVDSRKANSTIKKSKKKSKRRKSSVVRPDKEQLRLFEQFREQVFPNYQSQQLILFGDQLYDLPAQMDTDYLNGLNALRPGLHLGTFKKNRFEPALAWALASLPAESQRTLEISRDQWQQYVHGDVIKIDNNLPNGWYLLVCDQHTCGFGKLVDKTVKNFYPKGLRF